MSGPELLRRVLVGPEVKLRKRGAFLLNALAGSEFCLPQQRKEYFKKCAGPLVAIATGVDANDARAVEQLRASVAGGSGGGGGGGGGGGSGSAAAAAAASPVGGLEIDLRETVLRALTTFASRGFGAGLLLAPRGTAIQAARAAAGARAAAAAGEEKDNADAEKELWDGLWATAKGGPR